MSPCQVTYDARLVEEAVLRAEPTLPYGEQEAFRAERDRLYEVADREEREARFEELHGRWFLRLGLDRPLHRCLGEQPALLARTARCRVHAARSRREEMADVVPEAGRALPALVVALRPESLVEELSVLPVLRHELAHVADILDPAFGYTRELPVLDGGPSYENVLRDRYHAVWDATIDGRLVRKGLLDGPIREVRRDEFVQAFPMLGSRAEEAFEAWFGRDDPTHGEIVAFILNPAGDAAAGRCPVCRLPTPTLDPHPECLPAAALRELRAEHPSWREEQGLCSRCVEVYLARRPAGLAGSPVLVCLLHTARGRGR